MGLLLSVTTSAQKTVAVYVTSSEGVPQETMRILGSELVAAITSGASNVCVAEIHIREKDFYMFEDNTDKEYQELIKSHVYYIAFDNLYDC